MRRALVGFGAMDMRGSWRVMRGMQDSEILDFLFVKLAGRMAADGGIGTNGMVDGSGPAFWAGGDGGG